MIQFVFHFISASIRKYNDKWQGKQNSRKHFCLNIIKYRPNLQNLKIS